MFQLLAFFSFGPMELLIIGGVMLLLFGHRLPLVMRDLARGLKEFQHGLREPVPLPDKDDLGR
jgi:sec-independent protein translocase protein TatA